MDPLTVMFLQFYASLLSFGLLAWWYLVPWCRRHRFVESVTPILLAHSFRHMGLLYLTTAAVAPPVPAAFAEPTAYGDLATAALALLALLALRFGGERARPTVWLFNVVGFLDLGIAAINARRFSLIEHHIGVAYLLPVLVVPALIVTHVVVFWLLLRKEPPPVAPA